MNKNLLRAEIVKNGLTQREVAKAVGMSESTFVRKLKNSSFGLDEAQALIKLLKIENPSIIFFGK